MTALLSHKPDMRRSQCKLLRLHTLVSSPCAQAAVVALFQRDIPKGQQRQAADLAVKHGIVDVRL